MPDIRIRPAEPADAGEILTLQLAAYVTEAQLYGDPFLPPLVESPEGVAAAFDTGSVMFKAMAGSRLAGAVRLTYRERTCLIGRLVVAPDLRRRGIGRALMLAAHEHAAARADTCVLFTGHLSEGNLRLYRGLGYTESRRERLAGHLTLVHLSRPAAGPGAAPER